MKFAKIVGPMLVAGLATDTITLGAQGLLLSGPEGVEDVEGHAEGSLPRHVLRDAKIEAKSSSSVVPLVSPVLSTVSSCQTSRSPTRDTDLFKVRINSIP